jgi:putative transposase
VTTGLKRIYGNGHLHFITCSCYRRQPLLHADDRYESFLQTLETVRQRYDFLVGGYVVMPEHFHLLMSEPRKRDPSAVMFALKQTFAKRVMRKVPSLEHFWQKRFYDFNVYSHNKMVEKIHYMHHNPVVRGLVTSPSEWLWSSCPFYETGEEGLVKVDLEQVAKLTVWSD